VKYLLHGEKTERLRFRHIEESDFDDWLPFFEDSRCFQHWKPLTLSPEEECRQWYGWQRDRYENDHGGMNAMVEKSSGRLVGHSGILMQRLDDKEELEVAYSLLPEFWGRGYATEAAILCRNIAFQKQWGDHLISIISVTNTPSLRVAEKNGMKVRNETTYKDVPVKIYQIIREEWLES
jgi:RimJ/RimL family protein N-acetyltransferase